MTRLPELLRAVAGYETNNSACFLRTTFEDNFLHDSGTIPQDQRPQKLVDKRLCNGNASEINNNHLPFSKSLLNLQTYGERGRTHANHGTQSMLLQ